MVICVHYDRKHKSTDFSPSSLLLQTRLWYLSQHFKSFFCLKDSEEFENTQNSHHEIGYHPKPC